MFFSVFPLQIRLFINVFFFFKYFLLQYLCFRLQVAVIALAALVALTLAEHDATSYAFFHPKFHNTHHDGHDHYVSTLDTFR